jgi:hypothetical protein
MTGPACDFCNDIGASCRYPTRDFGLVVVAGPVVETAVDLGGGWWACDHCAPYIDDGRYEELARYTYDKWVAEQPAPPAASTARFVRVKHREMFCAFERNRTGTATRYVRKAAS